MTADSFMLYKLIILYFLYAAKQDISNAIISDFILQNRYTDYFSIQETLSSLKEDGLINAYQTISTAYYSLTDDGRETVQLFLQKLPADTVRQIDGYLKEHRIQIARDLAVRTDYTRTANGEYKTTCTVSEHGSHLFTVILNVPTEETAVKICRNFKENSDAAYSSLLNTLNR